MTKVIASFENYTVYVGLDIHKRSWNTAVYLNEQFVRNIHQPPSTPALYHYLHHNYPRAKYVCAYESGKFGYWIQRQLTEMNIECLVLNPADIPSSQKDASNRLVIGY